MAKRKDEYMTPQQAATYANVPLRTIQYAISKGHLKSKKYGRFRLTWPKAVDAWIASDKKRASRPS